MTVPAWSPGVATGALSAAGGRRFQIAVSVVLALTPVIV